MRANLREKFIMGGTIREGTRTEATEEGIGLKISNVKMAIQNQSVIEFYYIIFLQYLGPVAPTLVNLTVN
jgi:hypothetical protein